MDGKKGVGLKQIPEKFRDIWESFKNLGLQVPQSPLIVGRRKLSKIGSKGPNPASP